MMPRESTGDRVERGGFLLFLALISLATLAIVWPFAAPLLWATLAAIMFQPLYRWILARSKGHENQAAIATLLIILFAVILPAFWIGSMVVEDAIGVFNAFREGRVDVAGWIAGVRDALPGNLQNSLDSSGWADLDILRERLQQLASESAGLIAQQAMAIGSGALGLFLAFGVWLYVTYFLLRDGSVIAPKVLAALPLEGAIADRLADKFLGIVRATIKGSVVVGLVQGALGALTFVIVGIPSAMLLGLLMAVASLLPALGPALIWIPAAIYLLASGAVWEGVVVIVSGVAVIGMADNILRPILVGRETGIPDWVVLITTLGGIAVLGLSGIVVGPLVAGLFIASWTIMRERREGVGVA